MSYRRSLDLRIWGDAAFRELSRPEPNAQSLLLFLLLGPHTDGLPGLYRVGRASLAEAIEWEQYLEGLSRAAQELKERNLAEFDWEARVAIAPSAFDHAPPQSLSNVQGWRERFELVPESALKKRWAQIAVDHCSARGWTAPTWLLDAAGAVDGQSQGHCPNQSPTHRSTQGPGLEVEVEAEVEGEGEAERERTVPPASSNSPSTTGTPGDFPPSGSAMEEAQRLARLLGKLRAQNAPNAPPSPERVESWVAPILRAVDELGLSLGRISDAIEFSQRDDFWAQKISDGKSLLRFLRQAVKADGDLLRQVTQHRAEHDDTTQAKRARQAERRPATELAPPFSEGSESGRGTGLLELKDTIFKHDGAVQ